MYLLWLATGLKGPTSLFSIPMLRLQENTARTTSYTGAGDLNSAPCASAVRTLPLESCPKLQKCVKCLNIVSWGLRDRTWIGPCLRDFTFYPLCLLRRFSDGVIDTKP